VSGLNSIGEQFNRGEVFLPDRVMAGAAYSTRLTRKAERCSLRWNLSYPWMQLRLGRLVSQIMTCGHTPALLLTLVDPWA